jgi:hypothetical protein
MKKLGIGIMPFNPHEPMSPHSRFRACKVQMLWDKHNKGWRKQEKEVLLASNFPSSSVLRQITK